MKNNKKVNPFITTRVIVISTVFMLLFIAGVFIRTWLAVQCTRTGTEIAVAISEQQKLQHIHKNLKIELARLQSPQALGNVAREKFGLNIPKPDQIVIVP